jgi:hypothetical protein
VVHDPGQCGRDGLKEFLASEIGDQGAGDIEENLQTVALASELFLQGFHAGEIQDVVHSDSHQAGKAVEEADFLGNVVMRAARGEHQDAEAALRGGKRNHSERTGALLLHAGEEGREGAFCSDIVD